MEADFTMPEEFGVDGMLNIERELESFRRQWHDEIGRQRPVPGSGAPPAAGERGAREDTPQRNTSQGLEQRLQQQRDEPSIEEQARYLFIQGVSSEQSGRLSNAIQYYRRAVQLVPDIELRIDEYSKPKRREHAREESESSAGPSDPGVEDDDDVVTDLMEHILRARITEDDQAICRPNTEPRMTHMSSLPMELLSYILKWIVSNDLDIHSLEQVSHVCRGFYLCARDEELWRLVCTKIWGNNCGRPTSFGSYREMYINRPHLRFNGCYISKSSYFRDGEKSMDHYYRPYHIVEYFRYMRFFPEGQVLMLTTPDNPYTAIPNLRSRASAVQGLMIGYYKLLGDRVTLTLKRKPVASNDYMSSMYRYRRQKVAAQNNNNNESEQSFRVELIVKSVGGKPHWQLTWAHYSMHTHYRISGEEMAVDFPLNNSSYPHLLFSRVRSFTAVSDKPLK